MSMSRQIIPIGYIFMQGVERTNRRLGLLGKTGRLASLTNFKHLDSPITVFVPFSLVAESRKPR